jgi:16S rRNA (cytosine1402-N4)-methyltransferase
VSDAGPPHKRRVRYKGTHPRAFSEKYKELDPERYAADVEKVMARGATPAGGHRSILVAEVLDILSPKPGEVAIDATLGHGGHSMELLTAIAPGGRLYGLDRDPAEIEKTEARFRLAGYDQSSFVAVHMNFSDISQLCADSHPGGRVGGADMVLADLGVSSMQIDDPDRGFAFKYDGPLDMRMDPGSGQSAAELLGTIREADLRSMLEDYSDEPEARIIARVLTQRRGTVRTTRELRDAVQYALEDRVESDDMVRKSVRRTFQALRIAVNGELAALDALLAALPECLKPGGRVVILCFHSGEELRVQRSFQKGLERGLYSVASEEGLRAGPEERYSNPRSSSARLWWARKADASAEPTDLHIDSRT